MAASAAALLKCDPLGSSPTTEGADVKAAFIVPILIVGSHLSARAQTPVEPTVEQRPQLVDGSCRLPEFPAGREAPRAPATVTIEFVIGPGGTADSASLRILAAPDSLLAAMARAMILSCRYVPGKIGGQPVRTRSQQAVTFPPGSEARPSS
jgi:outer membrane biosynthesis protein TonB